MSGPTSLIGRTRRQSQRPRLSRLLLAQEPRQPRSWLIFDVGQNMHVSSSESIVQRQLDAYNSRDIEALLAVYTDDAQMFEHPSKLLASGTAELCERFTARFREPNLHAALLKRIVVGAIVIDHEKVSRAFPEGEGEIELVMIYEVKNDRIAKAWSIAGEKKIFVES